MYFNCNLKEEVLVFHLGGQTSIYSAFTFYLNLNELKIFYCIHLTICAFSFVLYSHSLRKVEAGVYRHSSHHNPRFIDLIMSLEVAIIKKFLGNDNDKYIHRMV